MEHIFDERMIEQYRSYLVSEEKSPQTIQKYTCDAKKLWRFLDDDCEVTKEKMIRFKEWLMVHYEVSSVNSILTAVNQFLKYCGWADCTVKTLKRQQYSFRTSDRMLSKEEYFLLLDEAKRQGNNRLLMIMQTICATGIRVSELQYITVHSVRRGYARVSLKGKTRMILIPKELQTNLELYIKENGLESGSVFVTRSGKPIDRHNIYSGMKRLCSQAGVLPSKVFPHNLRHLFAYTYYHVEKDLGYLADILGHSNINTTRIYTKISCEEQLNRMEGMHLTI